MKDVQKQLQIYHKEAEERDAKIRADKLGLPYFDLYTAPCEPDALKLISEKDSQEAEILAFSLKFSSKAGFVAGEKDLYLAVFDPRDDKAKKIISGLQNEGYEIKIFIVSKSGLKKTRINYQYLAKPMQEITGATYINREIINHYEANLNIFKKIADDLSNLKKEDTTEMITMILAAGLSCDASDIHIESQEYGIDMRIRVDGVLQESGSLEKTKYKSLLMRIKLLAKLKLNIRDKPQDGHFTIKVKDKEKIGNEIEIRVSVVPGPYGESVVLRILDPAKTIIEIDKLGLRDDILEIITEEAHKPQGFILNTGPTGSGKTTTLYAMLQKINSPDVKIVTIEDPIEYHVNGITQTQIDSSSGYTFATGLRSILRHDPDVILVGEIRDAESAEIAMQSAMTGHLVLSTIHANDSIAAIPRLKELKVELPILSNALNLIIGQRLLRKLCSCAKYQPLHPLLKKEAEAALNAMPIKIKKPDIEIAKIGTPVGCNLCNLTGYKGRIAVMEAYQIYPNVKKLITNGVFSDELLKAGLDHGFTTMQQDALLKVLNGVTSFEEAERIVGKTLSLPGKEIIDYVLFDEYRQKIVSIQDFQKIIKSLPKKEAKNLGEIIFAGGIIADASDILVEPKEDGSARIRLRIDGILYEAAVLEHDAYESILARIKYLSGAKIYINDMPQEGRFTIEAAGQEIEIRMSCMPGPHGESIALRVLNPENLFTELENLGLRPDYLKIINEEIHKPQGFILNTGPTGSGKTTTLYAMLQKINSPEIKIITIEDPIEYKILGITQSQVNEEVGYTFSSGLKSILRQNPNVVLVGEIRDADSADIALQSALTGHLILSTVHANDSAGAIPRLLEFKVAPNTIVAALNLIIAQRLTRRVCLKCGGLFKPPKEILQKIKTALNSIPKNVLFENNINIENISEIKKANLKGCAFCNFTGYKGRIAVYELLKFTRPLQTVISEKVSDIQIKVVAEKEGFTNMKQDALIKVLQGVIDFEEAERVLGKII